MKTLFIINSKSGKLRRDKTIIGQIENFSAEWEEDTKIAYTNSPKHATQLAAQGIDEGYTQIISVGGDGTLNEIARVLTGTDITLGIIPCGSGNGLARCLKLPLGIADALALLKKDSYRTIDTGIVNGIPFFNVMGVGFDAEMSRRFNGLTKRGFTGYLKLGMKTFFEYTPENYEITNDGNRKNVTAWIIAIANSSQYGNNAYIAPDAKIDDGRLDMVILPPVGVPKALGLVFRLFTGTITNSPSVYYRQSESFEIETEKPTILHADGEVFECGKTIKIETRPNSLKVRLQAVEFLDTP